MPPARAERIRNGLANGVVHRHISLMPDEPDHDPNIESLLRCPKCNREMRLLGIEPLNPTRELYTFECDQCGQLEVRGVRIS
jgi:hypothetical protein